MRGAADFGSAFHAGAEQVAKTLEVDSAGPYAAWLNLHRDWFQANCVHAVWTERVLVNTELGYAGTADLLVEHQAHGLTLVDYKTQGVKEGKTARAYPSWCQQLAAYRRAIGKPMACLSVIVNSAEPATPVEHLWTEEELESGWESFGAALVIWRNEKNYDPREKQKAEIGKAQARIQAQHLHQLNRQRQILEEEVLRQAEGLIREQGLAKRPVMVLGREGWHPGVLGIVAARLADEHHKPVALVPLEAGLGQGSARSIEGFHLFEGLRLCREALIKFGGHAAAAGFRLREEDLPALQEKLEAAFVMQVGRKTLRLALRVDAQVELPELDLESFEHLDRLRPFGPVQPGAGVRLPRGRVPHLPLCDLSDESTRKRLSVDRLSDL